VPLNPVPTRPIDPTPPKFDHITSRPVGSSVNGQVVANNSIFPVGRAKLVFVNTQGSATQQSITADRSGHFQVTLTSGSWSVYLSRPDGLLEYHSSMDVRENENRNVRVVSR
jgi:hypothetical protein